MVRNYDVTQWETKYFERQLWETTFAAVTENTPITEKQIIGDAWRSLPDTEVKQTSLAALLEHHWPDAIEEVPSFPSQQKSHDDSRSEVTTIPPAKSQYPSPEEHWTTEQNEYAETGEGTYINNAGLVLLHPFLPRFFKALGITTDDKIVLPDRALCLLHFLITGQTIAPEFELTLPKIFCNVPLDEPVESNMELTPAEQEEAVALLEAVIRHWEALRSTTPDGLRETFLVRPGKLSIRKDGDWLLQVESKTYDILLDHLPWGISMIRLPWMQRMLLVEWG